MKIPHHVILGGAASLLLTPVLGTSSSLFWLSSVLIDADHYWDYVYRNGFRDFSLNRAVEFNRVLSEKARDMPFVSLHALHTVEFLGLLAGVAATSGNPWLWAILWGILLHVGLDLAYVYSRRILFWRAFSVIEYAIRWNVMKHRGKRPELPYCYALQATLGAKG